MSPRVCRNEDSRSGQCNSWISNRRRRQYRGLATGVATCDACNAGQTPMLIILLGPCESVYEYVTGFLTAGTMDSTDKYLYSYKFSKIHSHNLFGVLVLRTGRKVSSTSTSTCNGHEYSVLRTPYVTLTHLYSYLWPTCFGDGRGLLRSLEM